jgi:PAS domain S-box-containing protein
MRSGSVSAPELMPTDATFRALIENSNDAIALFDSDWSILYASAASERILGYMPAELLRKDALSLVHQDDLDQVRSRFEECLAAPGKPIHMMGRLRHKDGSWRTLEGVFTNLMHDPQVRCIVNNYRDITDSIESETALRESEEKFKRTFQSNPNSMSINTLEEGIFLDVNDAFVRQTGYSREDLIGHSSTETSWANKEDRHRMLRLLRQHGRVEMETGFRTKTGKVLFSSLSAVIVEIGGVQCVLTTSQDITERKRAAEKLRRSEEQYRSLVELAPRNLPRDG